MVAIVAVDSRWGIGRGNALLFRLHDDMRRFRALTEGKTVLMGRRTLQSLPGGRGLPKRRNIVLTANEAFRAENAEVVHSAQEAAALAGSDAWVIGGASVYRLFLPLCERVYVTRIEGDGGADVFFPDLERDSSWRLESRSETQEENGVRFRYEVYVPVK